ncbi:uncharacterized protein SPPG_02620 [Spizellomyces punctatus DAOM BR117]|uniref:Uncharacterized protein n=1 Tax=Spizellomyces punctatus (strain DAOM BR117) TaxID=645134 RepID=A0A0L0HL21_SPIPD|nr:uncharacterized protein SPPG_02620 [Spizellomyces punctatus DAOM BR117]KND02126.1 hypothetical protein SPPG_02620 [Spizellomyces punctatus DAOM BR117]|eukprot:XP_016610165.1 hypothetical protein SPPG_02620 [Spizellomyces punctatus DAOM BR117]
MRVSLILSTALALVASLATVDAQVNLPPAGYPGPDSASSVTVASTDATRTPPPAPPTTSVVIKSAETLAVGGIETISINQGTQPPPPPPQQTPPPPPPPPPQQTSPSPTTPPVTIATTAQETRTNGGNQVTVTFLPHDPRTRGGESGGNGGNVQTVTVTRTVTIQVTNAAVCTQNTKTKGKHGHGKKSGNGGNGKKNGGNDNKTGGNGNTNTGNGSGGMTLVDAIREIFQLEPLPNAGQGRGNTNFASPTQTARKPRSPAVL